MSSPASGYDKQKLRELASAVMDATADDAQQRELSELLRRSPEARDEYLALVDLHAILATELATPSPQQASPPGSPRPPQSSKSQSSGSHRRSLRVAGIVALAACLLLAVSLFLARDRDIQPPGGGGVAVESRQFVTVAQVAGAVWDSDAFDVGNRFGRTTMQLKSGFVRLEFDSGVEVTLEGPAEFELVDSATAELKHGLLTATVPAGAEGFTVNTPTAEVIDLGTSFGIDLRDGGTSNVSVFDGEVEVAVRDGVDKRLLTEGESVRVGSDYEFQDLDFDPQPFEKLWPIASGIVGSTETIRFVPPWPRQIRFVASDNDIFVAPEGHSVELSSELKVNLSEPGDYASVHELTPMAVQPGQRIRSYILHYAPKTQLGPRRARQVTGSITFDRPVLGAIVSHEELLASSRRFGRRSAGEGNFRRELNLTGDGVGDRITLSEDRKTITLELIAPGRTSDLVRVIVDSHGDFRPPRRRNRIRR